MSQTGVEFLGRGAPRAVHRDHGTADDAAPVPPALHQPDEFGAARVFTSGRWALELSLWVLGGEGPASP